jgi:hypothetical protein
MPCTIYCLPSTQIYADQSSGKERSAKEVPASSELECNERRKQSSAIRASSKKETHSYESDEPIGR